MQRVSVGMLGGGTVGGGVYQALEQNGGLLAARLGIQFRVGRVAVLHARKRRPVKFPAPLLTTNWREVVRDPSIQVVVELMGGTTAARQAILEALRLGKPVITANKALLSACGGELFSAAQDRGTNLYYEASVAGGIPIIKVLREGLIGNRIVRLYGIVNGTCNFILTRMKQEGADFEAVLAEAQRLGYAEAEPSLDVDGHDAAHKAGILASLAHGFWVNPRQLYHEGIREVTPLDILFADRLGYTIKQLAIVKQGAEETAGRPGRGAVQVTVYPTLVPNSHVLASVNHVYNAVLVRGDVVGDTLYYGQGAGPAATASAVLSDLADAALDLKCQEGARVPSFAGYERNGRTLPIDAVVTGYYVRLTLIDKPGTLAKIAAILGRSHIGISSVIQPEGHEGESVPLILMIHNAPNARMVAALEKIRRLPFVKAKPVMFRVEDFES